MYLIETRLSAVVPLSVKLEFPMCVTVPDEPVISGTTYLVPVIVAANDPLDFSI